MLNSVNQKINMFLYPTPPPPRRGLAYFCISPDNYNYREGGENRNLFADIQNLIIIFSFKH